MISFLQKLIGVSPGGKTRSPLVDATMKGDLEATERALTNGSDPNEPDGDMSPLTWAIMGGHTDIVRTLLIHGADPNLRPTTLSEYPLWSAEDDFGLTEIAELLRSYGARKSAD